MIINCESLTHLAWLDSTCFDKEGFLFAREKRDGFIGQWKNQNFIERLIRLRGNILFILAPGSEPNYEKTVNYKTAADDRILYVLVLEEFVIKLSEEVNDKHFCFCIEFPRSETPKPFLFASISRADRDSWVESIHLASFLYLKSLYKNFLQLQGIEGDDFSGEEHCRPVSPRLEDSLSLHRRSPTFTLSCTVIFTYNNDLEPYLYIAVYHRANRLHQWYYLDKSEIVQSRSAKFSKQFFLPEDENTTNKLTHFLKFEVYNVIERLSATRVLLGQAVLLPGDLHKVNNLHFSDINIDSTLRRSQTIGKLKIVIRNLDTDMTHVQTVNPLQSCNNKRPQSLPINPVGISTDETLIESSSQNEKIQVSSTIDDCGKQALMGSCELDPSSQPRFSNSNFICADILSPMTPHAMAVSPILNEYDTNSFVNVVHRSFQFDIPLRNMSIILNEYMAESRSCLLLPQVIMNIFMDDEKKLMNCVTYSLGEVKTEFQRTQMRVLESHLRLVNVITESINELYQIQLEKRSFRPSPKKTEIYYQFVPLNFHLQRCLLTVNSETSPNDVDESDDSRDSILDVYTLGAFTCHFMGFDNGGLLRSTIELKNTTNQSAKWLSQQSLPRIWKWMKDFFTISSLAQQIDVQLKKMNQAVCDNESIESKVSILESCYQIIDLCAKKLVIVLDPNLVDSTLVHLEVLRNVQKSRSSHEKNSNFRESREEVDPNSNQPRDAQRSRSIDESFELEPIDLLHLNIKASIISMASKIAAMQGQNVNLGPSQRKLSSAIRALQRVCSICYAIEAVRLDREKLEAFYKLRLRRDMVFSQALTALIIAVCGSLNSTAFQEKLVDNGTVFAFFESVLSCYGAETGMIQDMLFAIEELNECVTFVFLNNRQFDGNPVPRIEGNGHSIRVILTLSSAVMPRYLECSVTALFFNIGFNETSTLAEAFGSVLFQEDINKKSFLNLENFITKRANVEDRQLIELLTALKTELWSGRPKNVRILALMERITYLLCGIRFSSCKSGKDRTSMAVTLEEVRFLGKNNHVDEINDSTLFQQMLDTLRSGGTRRENTRKNVGIAKYAFNSLKVITFPKLYRPPPGTYGYVQD